MEILLIIILGLVFGSFITMASYRLALEDNKVLDLAIKGSFCPKCNNILKIKNLIPLISFLLQKGRCSYCKEKIPIDYFYLLLQYIFLIGIIHFRLFK